MVRRPISALLHQSRMIDDECGAVGGMRIGFSISENHNINIKSEYYSYLLRCDAM
jgi:hypothetical protein